MQNDEISVMRIWIIFMTCIRLLYIRLIWDMKNVCLNLNFIKFISEKIGVFDMWGQCVSSQRLYVEIFRFRRGFTYRKAVKNLLIYCVSKVFFYINYGFRRPSQSGFLRLFISLDSGKSFLRHHGNFPRVFTSEAFTAE